MDCNFLRIARPSVPVVAVLVVLLVVLGTPSAAYAQLGDEGFSLLRQRPQDFEGDTLWLASARTAGHLKPWGTLQVGYAYFPYTVENDRGEVLPYVEHSVNSLLSAGLGLSDRTQVSLSMPLALYKRGPEPELLGVDLPDPAGVAPGDLALTARVRAVGEPVYGAGGEAEKLDPRLAFQASLFVPSGNTDRLMGDGGVGAEARAAGGVRVSALTLLANVGFRYRPERTYLVTDMGSDVLVGAGATYAVSDVRIEGALHGLVPVGGEDREVLLSAETGIRWFHRSGISLGASVTLGPVGGPGSGDVGGWLRLGWLMPSASSGCSGSDCGSSGNGDDRPGDGADDTEAGADNDGDGVADSRDRCPDEDETRNGYLDGDGCPDRVEVNDVVSTPEPILFGKHSVHLTPRMKDLLDAVAKAIIEHPEVTWIQVEGHSDSAETGGLKLSERRATVVKQALEGRGVDGAILNVVGIGADQPASVDEPRLNRRVFLRVLGR